MRQYLTSAFHYTAFALCLLSLLCSCNYKQELSEISDEVQRLQNLVIEINQSTENLLRLIAASQDENDWVTSIETIYEGEKETGTMIHFLHRESIFISNGKDGEKGDKGNDGKDGKDASAPVISIRQDKDGIWYWTMNGTWLLNDYGERIIARGTDGVAPKIKLESEKWWVSYDGGVEWHVIGNVSGSGWSSDTNYSQVSIVNGTTCEVTLKDGQKLYLPLWIEFDVSFLNGTTYYLMAGKTITVTAKISPYVETEISTVCDNGLSVGKIETSEGSEYIYIPIQATGAFVGGNVRLVFSKGGKLVYKQLTIKPLDYSDKSVEKVILSKSTLELAIGCSSYLSASVLPDNPSYNNIIWSTDNQSVASVSSYGIVKAISAGRCRITATAHNGKNASCEVIVGSQKAVDFGLSVKWSEYNLGSSSTFETGDYFAWGEIESKEGDDQKVYYWTNYSLCNGSPNALLRYNTKSSFGKVDNVTELYAYDDAATSRWGGGWRTPSSKEWAELYDNCTWEWLSSGATSKYIPSFKSQNDGYLVIKGGTGIARLDTSVYIFIPAGGFFSGSYIEDDSVCHYWSRNLYAEHPDCSLEFVAGASLIKPQYSTSRCFGLTIRPVFP